MNPKISDEVARQLEKAGSAGELPVVVKVKDHANLALLEQKGLRIERKFENISDVAGKMPAAAATQIADLDFVERVEYDGEMHALGE
jgi:hypothetical protein